MADRESFFPAPPTDITQSPLYPPLSEDDEMGEMPPPPPPVEDQQSLVCSMLRAEFILAGHIEMTFTLSIPLEGMSLLLNDKYIATNLPRGEYHAPCKLNGRPIPTLP